MAAITDYKFDTSFLDEVFEFLIQQHQVYAIVVDSKKQPVYPNSPPQQENASVIKFFPFVENTGGLLCAAENNEQIKAAEPQITLCLEAVNDLLIHQQEVGETSNEMVELSKQLNFLFNLAKEISDVTQINKFCDIILQAIANEINADYAFLQLAMDRANSPDLITCRIDSDAAREITHQEYFQENMTEKTIIFSLQDGTSSIMAPIIAHDKITGCMAFFRGKKTGSFRNYEKEFVSIVDKIISPSLETFTPHNSLQKFYLNTVKALADAIDSKGASTQGHSFRVAKLALAIGGKLDLKEKTLEDLEMAAYMHDLGKIGVPEEILSKPDKLTDGEFKEVQRYPVLTKKIFELIKLPDFIVEGAVLHQERLDGTGYPFGMKGKKIPLSARIIAVADVFDALTSSRPYRNAMAVEKAFKIMYEEVPMHLDPDIVFALVSVLRDENIEKELQKSLTRYADTRDLKKRKTNQ